MQKSGSDQTLRRDQGATLLRVVRVELGIGDCQCIVHNLLDIAKRMTRRNARLKVHIDEQRPLASSVPRVLISIVI